MLVDTEDERVALAAVKDILDRNDFTGKAKREHTGPEDAPTAIIVEFVGPEDGEGA